MTAVADRRATGAPGGARFIDPAVLARIGNLELLARVVVEGFMSGLHRSPHLGSSTDFAEHRAYMPGDDIRRIDWKLYARSDRHYVKEFEADTNTNFSVLLDVSPSMFYGGTDGRPSKIDYGRYLAACLSYFSSMQRDRVGLVTFADSVVDYIPPGVRQLQTILHTLDGVERSRRLPRARQGSVGRARLADAFRELAASFRRRSVIALVSDLYEEPSDVLDALANLRGKGNDLIVFHVLDSRELEFPFTESSNFVDLETGARMPVIPDYLRKEYRALLAAHTAGLARTLGESRIDYALFDTSKPLDYALFSYLSARERMSRVR